MTRPIWLRRSVHPHVAQVDAVEPHAALHRIEEPRHQAGQRGLATAVRADQGDRFSKRNAQVDVVQYRLLRRVAERHVIEDQIAVMAVQGLRLRRIADGGLAVQGEIHAVGRGRSPLQFVEHFGEPPRGIAYPGQESVEDQ